MRVFFAIDIPTETKHLIQAWRHENVQGAHQPVATQNLHLTLAFIGQVQAEDLTRLYNIGAHCRLPTLNLHLDHIDYFPNPKVLWLGASTIPPVLFKFATQLQDLLRQAGFVVDNRVYRPHISLYRKTQANQISVLQSPSIQFQPRSFSLYQSQSSEGGVIYIPLKTW